MRVDAGAITVTVRVMTQVALQALMVEQ